MRAGCNNTALGAVTLFAKTNEDRCGNTAVGAYALANSGADDNTAVGLCAAYCAGGNSVGNGGQNTVIGSRAGLTLTSGCNNVVIGFNAQPATAASANTVTLGNASITTIRAQVTTITSLSDARDKTDVTALPVGLDLVNSLKPVKFTWQMREPNEVKDGTSEAGFIAQELQAVEVEYSADYLGLVYDENPAQLEASPGKLIPVLVKAIQELSAKNDALEARIAQLEGNG
jgi:hypothetical protein